MTKQKSKFVLLELISAIVLAGLIVAVGISIFTTTKDAKEETSMSIIDNGNSKEENLWVGHSEVVSRSIAELPNNIERGVSYFYSYGESASMPYEEYESISK